MLNPNNPASTCNICDGEGRIQHPHNGDWNKCYACTPTYARLDVRSWQMSCAAPIVTIDEFINLRRHHDKVVVTSGGFDPIHPGHISVINESFTIGTTVVIVNGDAFLTKKKGKPFMDLKTRCQIVSNLAFVDFVIPYESPVHMDVSEALRIIRPTHFTKGGDRVDEKSIPEWNTCKEIGCEIVTGVGEQKLWSSSNFLGDWTNFKFQQKDFAQLMSEVP